MHDLLLIVIAIFDSSDFDLLRNMRPWNPAAANSGKCRA
jgi:hypothetical protein